MFDKNKHRKYNENRAENPIFMESPVVIIEVAVLSAKYDLNEKNQSYKEAGVLEYIVLDHQSPVNRVHYLVLKDDDYKEIKAKDGVFHSKNFDRLALHEDAVLTGDKVKLRKMLYENNPEQFRELPRVMAEVVKKEKEKEKEICELRAASELKNEENRRFVAKLLECRKLISQYESQRPGQLDA